MRAAVVAAAPQAQSRQVEVADVGPEAVAKAKRHLPTGQAYASAPGAGARAAG